MARDLSDLVGNALGQMAREAAKNLGTVKPQKKTGPLSGAAGDIQINLLDIELLTIKLRLLVASVDKAKEMGIDWWESDAALSSDARRLADENGELRERLRRLEERLELRATGGESREEVRRRE